MPANRVSGLTQRVTKKTDLEKQCHTGPSSKAVPHLISILAVSTLSGAVGGLVLGSANDGLAIGSCMLGIGMVLFKIFRAESGLKQIHRRRKGRLRCCWGNNDHSC